MRKQVLRYRFLAVVILFLFMVSGCTVRNYTVVRERQDIQQEGNKGYLLGAAPEREEEMKTTRNTYVFEVEFGKGSKTKAGTPQMETGVAEPVEEEVAEVEYVVEEAATEAPVVIEVGTDFK